MNNSLWGWIGVLSGFGRKVHSIKEKYATVGGIFCCVVGACSEHVAGQRQGSKASKKPICRKYATGLILGYYQFRNGI